MSNNHMPNETWDKNTYPFPILEVYTDEVWEWVINFFPHFTVDVLTFPC